MTVDFLLSFLRRISYSRQDLQEMFVIFSVIEYNFIVFFDLETCGYLQVLYKTCSVFSSSSCSIFLTFSCILQSLAICPPFPHLKHSPNFLLQSFSMCPIFRNDDKLFDFCQFFVLVEERSVGLRLWSVLRRLNVC